MRGERKGRRKRKRGGGRTRKRKRERVKTVIPMCVITMSVELKNGLKIRVDDAINRAVWHIENLHLSA